MYLVATLELSYGGYTKFVEIAPIIRRAMEACGCTFLHAMMPVTGRMFSLIHIWQVPSIESLNSIGEDKDFAAILPILQAVVVRETLVFTVDAPYAPQLVG